MNKKEGAQEREKKEDLLYFVFLIVLFIKARNKMKENWEKNGKMGGNVKGRKNEQNNVLARNGWKRVKGSSESGRQVNEPLVLD